MSPPDPSTSPTPNAPVAPEPAYDRAALGALAALCGDAWKARIAWLQAATDAGGRTGQALQQRHAIECVLHRMLRQPDRSLSAPERMLAGLATRLALTADSLPPAGRDRLRVQLRAALDGSGSLLPLFHLMRVAFLQQRRGFAVGYSGLADGAPFDLTLTRDGAEAELSCETVSAEDGRDLHRGAWFNLVDGIDPDLQTWLSAHPGRYLLKLTLPQGLRTGPDDNGGLAQLAELQGRIRDLLSRQTRSDQDAAAVLRLDPLLLAGAQAGEHGMLTALRQQFGPEAQLAVTRSGSGVFVMAARSGRVDEIGAAMRRRMQQVTPGRFTGTRPGILAMFLDDTDRAEWRALRDGLQLEGETRQFLTSPQAAGLVAVTAASRAELFGAPAADMAPDGELRFRNQAHSAAKSPALAPAIRSSV